MEPEPTSESADAAMPDAVLAEPTAESADAAMPDAVKAEPSEPPPASKEPKKYILERGSEPALGLLAALGVERSTAMEHLADRAAVRLVEAIPSMPPRRRLALLSASFPHVDVPRLRPIAVAALVHAPELPDHIVSALTSDANQPLLRELPMRVRQRVWETQTPPQLFLTETHTFLHALMQECEQRFQRSALREAAEVPPKQRRAESAALKSLAELVGAKPLYAALTALCASIYFQTGNAAMGALRCDLLMALNEADDATKPGQSKLPLPLSSSASPTSPLSSHRSRLSPLSSLLSSLLSPLSSLPFSLLSLLPPL